MPTTDLMTALPVETASFTPLWRQELSRQAGGTPRIADLGPELWQAKFTAKVGIERLRQVEALINAMRGSISTFYAWNPMAQFPQADPAGAILGVSTVTIFELSVDTKSLRLAGLPVGYAITSGDFLAFDTTGPRRCLHQFVASAVADGAGRIPLTEVVPNIRAGATVGLTVSLIRPAAEMFILPGSYDSQSSGAPYSQISFSALQVP
jgi:hypothetical protein